MLTPELPEPLTPLLGWIASAEPKPVLHPQSWGNHLPRISIVTPSFNQAEFIESTIRSVLLQGYPNLNYIVIDGGSSDHTVEILQHYHDHLSYWVSEPDRGQSHAINKGMAIADGDVCGWLCSDDLFATGALIKIGDYLARHPECEWLAGDGEFIHSETNEVERFEAGIRSSEALLEYWRYGAPGYFLPQPSTFWSRVLWDHVEGLREDNHLAMDYELWLRFEELTKLHRLKDVLSMSQLHNDCKTQSRRSEQCQEMMRCAYEASLRRGQPRYRLSLKLLSHWLLRWRLARSRRHLASAEFGEAAAELVKAIKAPLQVWHEPSRMAALEWNAGSQ
ncbi:Chondroitin synthase [Novipirellula aureliae]|uniref:Chondroitin synthase n=1 Tax=Novipirellula aureliae TaxID=2527966 RepID=A0A5C6E0X3_9BACT|nr:glycosyltransferase family 2 protein [Novipirellula aureliae]TWU41301.1 Chondroitin synthase [Novipirellula aureliae]